MSDKEDKTEDILSKQELHLENLDAIVTRKPGCQVEIEVEVGPDHYSKAENAAIKKIRGQVSLPGFRKGKAPADYIKKNYAQAIKDSISKEMADVVFKEVQAELKIHIASSAQRINFTPKSIAHEKSILLYNFEQEPEVPDVDVSKFHLHLQSQKEIGDKEVDEVLDQIRQFFQKFEKVKRPVEEGDFVLLDVYDLDGEERDLVFDKARFEVKKGQMAEWLYDLVIGTEPGKEVEGVSRPDASESQEAKKEFKEKKVSVTVVEVEKADLPELNEEFAEKLGVKTMETLRERLLALKTKQEAERVLDHNREEIAKQLVATHEFDIPKSFLDKESEHRLQTIKTQDQARWEKLSDDEKAKEEEMLRQKAKESILLFYHCRKIMQDNKIELDRARLQNKNTELLDMMFAKRQYADFDKLTEDQQSLELTKLMLEQAEEFLLDKVNQNS